MKLQIISQLPRFQGRPLKPYQLDGVPTVGVHGNEPFSIRFQNPTSQKVQIKLAVDGTDVLSGKPADLEVTSKMWVVDAYATMELRAWPENHNGGARFVFTTVENSVALHTHGDLTAKGYISAAVWTEGYNDINTRARINYGGIKGGGGIRGEVTKGMHDRGDLEMTTLGGPAVGAGEHVEQHIGQAQGLIRPVFSQILQVRYLWWDDVEQKLRLANAPQHPTGFEHGQLADLGNTPRLTTEPVATNLAGYNRFE